jgi:hypothetical protein
MHAPMGARRDTEVCSADNCALRDMSKVASIVCMGPNAGAEDAEAEDAALAARLRSRI